MLKVIIMLLLKNSQGQLVKKLQQKLSELGYNVGPIDGIFGPRTEEAVIKFQTDRGLDIDGVVGNQTWGELFKEPVPEKANLEFPPFQDRCFEVYGDFRIKGWRQQELIQCDLSFAKGQLDHVLLGWGKPQPKGFVHSNWFGFWAHRLVVPKFIEAFQNVVNRGLSEQIKTYDGCFNPRMIRGGKTWSTHSWGIAIDINAAWNRMGQKNFEMSEDLAKCFEDVGFIWGGRWASSPDAMHFQYATIR